MLKPLIVGVDIHRKTNTFCLMYQARVEQRPRFALDNNRPGTRQLVQPILVVDNSRLYLPKGRCYQWTPSNRRGILGGVSRLNSPRRLHENRISACQPPDSTRNSPTYLAYSPIYSAQNQAAEALRAQAQDTQTPQAQNRRRLPILEAGTHLPAHPD